MTLIQEFLHLMYQKSTHKVGGHSIALACRMRKWEVNALFSLLKWNEMSANSAISIRLWVTYLDKNWHLIHFTNRLNVVDGYLLPFLFITTSSTSHSCHIVYENRWIYVILSLRTAKSLCLATSGNDSNNGVERRWWSFQFHRIQRC